MILKNKSKKLQFKKIRDEQQNIIQLCHVDDDAIFGQGNQVQTEPELIQIPDFSKQAGVKLRDSIGPQNINIQSADNYFIPFISERDRMGNLITSKINRNQNKTQGIFLQKSYSKKLQAIEKQIFSQSQKNFNVNKFNKNTTVSNSTKIQNMFSQVFLNKMNQNQSVSPKLQKNKKQKNTYASTEKANRTNNQYIEGKDVKYNNQMKVENNQILQQKETIAVQGNIGNIIKTDQKNSFNETEQQNLFQRDKSENNKQNQKNLKSSNEQLNFDVKYYKKTSFQTQGRKIRKNMNINQINQGKISLTPNSLLANLKTNTTLKNTDISKDSSFNLSKIEIDEDKQLKPSLDDNDNWAINYYVSDKALIQGSNRKQIQMYLKTKNMRLESRSKMKSNQAFLTPGRDNFFLLNQNQACIGLYNPDIKNKFRQQPNFSIRKFKDKEKQNKYCNEDFYDIQKGLISTQPQITKTISLDRGHIDRFHNIQKKKIINKQEQPVKTSIPDQMDFIKKLSNQYNLPQFPIPPSYLLQHDLKKRQTQDQMLIEWNEKIQQYGYKFDRKGLKKFFGEQIAVKTNK